MTFMPKPIFGDNGSGMHPTRASGSDGKPLFAGKEYAGVSQICLHYIGGILKHAPRAGGFTNRRPTRVQTIDAGFEAPVLLAYSSRNRSAGTYSHVLSRPESEADRCVSGPTANPATWPLRLC